MVQFKTHILKAAVDLFQWRRKVGGGVGETCESPNPRTCPGCRACAMQSVWGGCAPQNLENFWKCSLKWHNLVHHFSHILHCTARLVSIGVSPTIYLQSNTFYADIESKVEGPCPCPLSVYFQGHRDQRDTIFYCTVFPSFIEITLEFYCFLVYLLHINND